MGFKHVSHLNETFKHLESKDNKLSTQSISLQTLFTVKLYLIKMTGVQCFEPLQQHRIQNLLEQ